MFRKHHLLLLVVVILLLANSLIMCGYLKGHTVSAQSARDQIFDVTAYGAKGDCTAGGALGSCTNDVAAARLALAAAIANGGGTVYFPKTVTNAYYLLVGTPGVDGNLTNIDPNHYAIFNVTSNNITFKFARGVTLRVVSTHIYQTTMGGGSIPGQTALFWFGNQVTVIENFMLDGDYPTLSFELSGVSFSTGDNSANGFLLQSGKTKRAHWKRFYVTGFPQGGLLDGYTSGSDQLCDAVYEDMRVLNYGSGGDDLWFYTYGNVTFLRCWFITSLKSSHGVYSGATKPGVVIKDCYFQGQDESAALNNKFGIQVYQTSGTDAIRDWEISGNTFYNVRNPIWIEHANGGAGGTVRNVNIRNNNFLRSGATPTGTAIQGQWMRDSDISGNFFQTMSVGISLLSSGAGKNILISKNRCYDCTTLMNVNTTESVITENSYRRSSIASTGATRFTVTGARNTVAHNEMIDGGSSAGSPVGMIVNGANCIIDGNMFYATASQGYSICLQVISSQGKVINNIVNHTGSAYSDLSGDDILVAHNYSNKLVTLNGTGSGYSRAIGNKMTAQMRLTGLVIPQNNDISSWETITGAYGGSGNFTSSADLDVVATTTSGTYTPHVGTTSTFLITANGNLTLGQPTNPLRGKVINFVILQDATGGRTITPSSTYYVSNCAVTTTANTRTSFSFVYDSAISKFVQVGACLTGY